MKRFLAVAILLAAFTAGYAQCEKKTVLTAAKTDHLAADSSVKQSEDGAVTVEFDKTTFNVYPSNGNPVIGKVNSSTCNWPTPFKVGKTQMKVTITNDSG